MLARLQEKPHWIFMANYTNQQLDKWAEMYLRNELSQLIIDVAGKKLDSQLEKLSDFLNFVLYEGFIGERIDKNLWKEHIVTVDKILKHLCKFYQKIDAYNSFKHGLRFSSLAVQLEIEGKAILSSPNSVVYFSNKGDKVHETIEGVSFEANLKLIEFMCLLLRGVKLFRLAAIEGNTENRKMNFIIFYEEAWVNYREKLKSIKMAKFNYGPI